MQSRAPISPLATREDKTAESSGPIDLIQVLGLVLPWPCSETMTATHCILALLLCLTQAISYCEGTPIKEIETLKKYFVSMTLYHECIENDWR